VNTDNYKEIINNKQFVQDTFDGLIGHKIIEINENYVETSIDINESHLQPFGLVHGGVYSSMAESAISYAASINQEAMWAGVNNNTDFIASATDGTLILKGTPIKLGKRSQLWVAEIFNNDVMCARSTVRLSNLGNK
tara:strand:+ start:46 stop:456 length:411 start_codon:yes stop_codon:yes gene_type:complete